MPLRYLLSRLLNNEQLIEKLAQSYPIRRAAQLTAYLITKGRYKGQQTLEELKKSNVTQMLEEEVSRSGGKLKSFAKRFQEELQEGLKEMKKKK